MTAVVSDIEDFRLVLIFDADDDFDVTPFRFVETEIVRFRLGDLEVFFRFVEVEVVFLRFGVFLCRFDDVEAVLRRFEFAEVVSLRFAI